MHGSVCWFVEWAFVSNEWISTICLLIILRCCWVLLLMLSARIFPMNWPNSSYYLCGKWFIANCWFHSSSMSKQLCNPRQIAFGGGFYWFLWRAVIVCWEFEGRLFDIGFRMSADFKDGLLLDPHQTLDCWSLQKGNRTETVVSKYETNHRWATK